MKLGIAFVRILVMIVIHILNMVAHVVALCMPVGVYVLLLQLRSKCSVISSISTFAPPESTWQFIYPNTIMVTTTPNLLKTKMEATNRNITAFCTKWKTTLISVFAVLLLAVLTAIALLLVR